MKQLIIIISIISFYQCTIDGQNTKKVSKPNTVQLDDKGTQMIEKAKAHLGKPYLAHTLDTKIEEELTVITNGFDCTTLVETVLAEVNKPEDIRSHVKLTRYRGGEIIDYASRIHYFTEWIYENAKNGIVKDITPSIECSLPYKYQANFMSQNRSKYKQIKNDDVQLEKIKKMEENINQYKWSYIPKASLKKCESKIKNGDIIAITTNIKGLETSHIGIAIWENKILKLLHASTDEKKVVITKNSMYDYLMRNSKQTGIMVVRVL